MKGAKPEADDSVDHQASSSQLSRGPRQQIGRYHRSCAPDQVCTEESHTFFMPSHFCITLLWDSSESETFHLESSFHSH